MHSHERRLAAIEERRRREAEKRAAVSGSGEPRRFLSSICHAIGHIRREEIDAKRGSTYRYGRATLATLPVVELAAYAVALKLRNHPDHDEAHALLRDAEGGSQYFPLIDNAVSRLRSTGSL